MKDINIQEQLKITLSPGNYTIMSIPDSLMLYDRLRSWLRENGMIDSGGTIIWKTPSVDNKQQGEK